METMNRDMNLICRILRYAEGNETDHAIPAPRISGYTDAQVRYHIGLCVQAGYLTAEAPKGGPSGSVPRYTDIGHLTCDGHEALDELCPQA